MKRLATLTLVLVTSGLGSWAAVEASVAPAEPAYEPVDSFRFFGNLDNWRAVDTDTVIVWATPFRPYLLNLSRPSRDLRSAQTIGVTSTIGKVYVKLDAVVVAGIDYPIDAIYRMSRDEARQIGRQSDLITETTG